jgi:hypothetical protein
MSEASLHSSVVSALQRLKRPGVMFWHAANGEKRDVRTAGKLRCMGVLPGVSDLTVSLPDGGFGFLEPKWDRNRLTPEQGDFLAAMAERGHLTGVAYTLDAALALLAPCGALRNAKPPRHDSELTQGVNRAGFDLT